MLCRTLNSKEGFTKECLCGAFGVDSFVFIPTENCEGNDTKYKPFPEPPPPTCLCYSLHFFGFCMSTNVLYSSAAEVDQGLSFKELKVRVQIQGRSIY